MEALRQEDHDLRVPFNPLLLLRKRRTKPGVNMIVRHTLKLLEKKHPTCMPLDFPQELSV